MEAVNIFNWSYNIIIEKVPIVDKQDIFKLGRGTNRSEYPLGEKGISGSINKTSHTIEYKADILMNLNTASQLVIYNLPDDIALQISQSGTGMNYNSDNTFSYDAFVEYVDLTLTYQNYTLKQSFIVKMAYQEGFPDRRLIIIMTCVALDQYNLNNKTDGFVFSTRQKQPKYKWIQEMCERYNVVYYPEHNFVPEQLDEISPPLHTTSFLSFLQSILPNCYFYIDSKNELFIAKNNVLLGSGIDFIDKAKFESVEALKIKYADYLTNHPMLIIDAMVDKIKNIPYFTANYDIIIQIPLRLDFTINRLVKIINDKRYLLLHTNTSFVCNGCSISLRFSNVSGCNGNTILKLVPYDVFNPNGKSSPVVLD